MQRQQSIHQATQGNDQPGDRIYRATRVAFALLTPFLALAFVILYFFPDDTGEHFAWAINPEMTPMIMGSGYIAGAYYFVRLATGSEWHRMGVTLPAVTVFATTMAVLTVIHWENFNHDHLAFILWVILYVVAPPLVLGLWLWNRREDPRIPARDDIPVPPPVRVALMVAGMVALATALWLFLFPDSATEIWPWQLSPLTARVMAGWVALGGTASLLLGRDPRWSSWKIPFETTLIWSVLVAIAIFRARDNFDWGSASSWIFLAIVALWVTSFASLLTFMELRKQRLQQMPATQSR